MTCCHRSTGLTGMPTTANYTTVQLHGGYSLYFQLRVCHQDRDRIFVRQYGQSAHFRTHGSKHVEWNLWPQRNLISSSPSLNPSRQIEHSGDASLLSSLLASKISICRRRKAALLSPADRLELVDLMVGLSSSDSLLGWNDDEWGRFASWRVSLFVKSMILNTSLAENSSNEMDGLEADEPREMPLSLSRTRACACSTAPGSRSLVLNISLSSLFLRAAESPMLLLSMYDKIWSCRQQNREILSFDDPSQTIRMKMVAHGMIPEMKLAWYR